MTNDSRQAYVAGLKLLGRRELSEAQVRQRLARLQHDPDAIDAAVARLLDEHAIDDNRVAEAIARTETGVRRRGKLRVLRKIESAGIATATATRAVDAVLGDLEPGALLEAALHKRLRGRDHIADQAEFARLYRYLVGQGFESDHVLARLQKHYAGHRGPRGHKAHED
jgi:regulatory protein